MTFGGGCFIAEADMTTIQLLVTAIAGLSGAIVVMWVFFQKRFSRTETKLDQCEIKHEAANDQMLKLSMEYSAKIITFAEQVGDLKGRLDVMAEQMGHKQDKR